MTTKVRKTLTLDEHLVELFAADDPENLSGAINTALALEAARRERRASLTTLLDELRAQYGPAESELMDEFRGYLS
jgi:hypothetical protein